MEHHFEDYEHVQAMVDLTIKTVWAPKTALVITR